MAQFAHDLIPFVENFADADGVVSLGYIVWNQLFFC